MKSAKIAPSRLSSPGSLGPPFLALLGRPIEWTATDEELPYGYMEVLLRRPKFNSCLGAISKILLLVKVVLGRPQGILRPY